MDNNEIIENNQYSYQSSNVDQASYLQLVMTNTFVKMIIALIVSGIVSFLVYATDLAYTMLFNGMFYVVAIAELIVIIVCNRALKKRNAQLANVMFYLYSVLTGITLSIIFIAYELNSIIGVFFISSAMFLATVVYGYTTKKDLTGLGSILIMALVGIIITTIVNVFIFQSEGLDLIISYIGVAIFLGLTIYDTQKIKKEALSDVSCTNGDTISTFGALNLYLDLINIFLYLLRILGKRK